MTCGGKGRFAKGKPAGLFFPHRPDGTVHLPQKGETWYLVEGVKDAAALHGLGLLACGLNTNQLSPVFGRLFRGVHVILIPDRDRAGEQGAAASAQVLRGIATEVRIAVLPAKFKARGGEDVRDILRKPNGQQFIEQCLADAQPVEWENDESSEDHQMAPELPMAVVELPNGEPLTLTVFPPDGRRQHLIIVRRGDFEFRDQFNVNNSTSRDRFLRKLTAKLGVSPDELAERLEAQILKLADQCDEGVSQSGGVREDAPGQATLIVTMAADWDLWHTPGKETFTNISVNDHEENVLIKSHRFRRYVCKQFYEAQGKVITSEALSTAINLLEARAHFDGEVYAAFVRVAEQNEKVYLELCNEGWQVVGISAKGWTVLDRSPVRFRRSKGMLALPVPEPGGAIDDLREFLNVDESSWILLVSWLIASFRPQGPYPVLALFAEQGAGKSTAGRMLRNLIDPNSAL
jgi:DNA primase